MEDKINRIFGEAVSVKQALLASDIPAQVARIAATLKERLARGGTLYCCGNGGSACDAMHFTEELVSRFKRERPGIRAMHFLDAATLTCWSNDYDFEGAFERQVRTFCTEKDALCLISTSGNSANICRAAVAAREQNTYTFALTGKDGGLLSRQVDDALIVPSQATERIQEAHILLIHTFCELLET
jgi:Phosphoheptose isomerase